MELIGEFFYYARYVALILLGLGGVVVIILGFFSDHKDERVASYFGLVVILITVLICMHKCG